MLRHGNRLLSGESTPEYLFDPNVPPRVGKAQSKLRILVLLRNPVDRAYSHYQHLLRLDREKRPFALAIDEELSDRPAASGSRGIAGSQAIAYLARGHYAEQLERWLQHFDRSQIHVIKSETFFSHPAQELDRVYDFLNIPTFLQDHYPKCNSGSYKSLTSESREKLNQYFAPHNRRLFEILEQNYHWAE